MAYTYICVYTLSKKSHAKIQTNSQYGPTLLTLPKLKQPKHTTTYMIMSIFILSINNFPNELPMEGGVTSSVIKYRQQRKLREGRGMCWHTGMRWWHHWAKACHHWQGNRCIGGAWTPWGWWGVQSWTNHRWGEWLRCHNHWRTCSLSQQCR